MARTFGARVLTELSALGSRPIIEARYREEAERVLAAYRQSPTSSC